MKHFENFTSYVRFVGAKEFIAKEDSPFVHHFNWAERVGSVLIAPFSKPSDYAIRNIRNPLFILSMTLTALFFTTLLYYPKVVSTVVVGAPFLRFVAFILTESAILGICLRTLGRLQNRKLMNEWDAKNLIPLPIGALKI